MRNTCAVFAALAILLSAAGAAQAHRLNLFAYADGTQIVGSAYFSGGGAPDGAIVTAYAPDGTMQGQTATDAEGAFALEAAARVDHRITVETVDGHAAAFVVAAAELPASLPAPDGAAVTTLADQAAPAAADPATEPVAAVGATDLEALVEQSVRRQIQPLREDLAALSTRVRLQDILGGIGYIVGMFGFVAYIMSLRRQEAAGQSGSKKPTAAE